MCGRFVSVSSPQLLVDRFSVDESTIGEREPNYNVTPRADVLIVRERRPRGDDIEPTRVLSLVRWGLVPSWAESPAIGDKFINARGESVADSGAYKNAFRRRRCIVPADAFYEWKPGPRGASGRLPRQPYLVRRRDGEPLALAGLWEIWRDAAVAEDDAPDAWLRTCTIVTTRANPALAPVHDRMPVILAEDAWSDWLDPTNADPVQLQSYLRPAPDEWLEVYPVSTRVNRPENNDADLLRRVELTPDPELGSA